MIGQDIAGGLIELAAQAESLMTDACTVQAKPTHGAADPTTGARTDVAGVVRYSGKCRVRRADNLADNDQRAEQVVKVARYFVTVPAASVVSVGDTVTVTATADLKLLGGALTVVEVVEGTIRFQRRLLCIRDT